MPTLDERIAAARKLEGYTPGPWDASGLTIYDTCMDGVASCHTGADARLIAAAPDLHRLVLDLAAERERLLAENERMREALAGLSNALELPQQRGVLTLVPEALERARAALASEPLA